MTQNTNTDPAERAKAHVTKYPTKALVEALIAIDATPKSAENSMVRKWLIQEVERRFPVAANAVAAAYLASELAAELDGGPAAPVDYVAVLVANIQIV